MLAKLQNYFFNKFAGKVLARGAVSLAALLAGEKAQKLLGGVGLSVSVDPDQLVAGALVLGHGLFEFLKAKLNKPEAPKA